MVAGVFCCPASRFHLRAIFSEQVIQRAAFERPLNCFHLAQGKLGVPGQFVLHGSAGNSNMLRKVLLRTTLLFKLNQ